MIIKRAAFEARLAKKEQTSLPRALLLYGPNEGLARYYEQRMLRATLNSEHNKNKNNEGVVRATVQSIAKRQEKLADMLCSPSLFGGKRVVLLEVNDAERFDARKLFGDCLEEIAKGKGEGVLIVRAGRLRKEAGLRKIFEQKATTFACYEERGDDLVPMLREVLDKEGVTVENSLLQAIGETLAIDRIAALQEMEKIVLYYGIGGTIDAQVWELLSDWREARIGELLYDAFDGHSENCLRALDKLRISQVSGIVVVRSAMRHIQCLRRLRELSSGDSGKLRSAIASWRPFVLFHLREKLNRQVGQWDATSLHKSLGDGLDCENSIKSKSGLQWVLTERYILEIARRATMKNKSIKFKSQNNIAA